MHSVRHVAVAIVAKAVVAIIVGFLVIIDGFLVNLLILLLLEFAFLLLFEFCCGVSTVVGNFAVFAAVLLVLVFLLFVVTDVVIFIFHTVAVDAVKVVDVDLSF